LIRFFIALFFVGVISMGITYAMVFGGLLDSMPTFTTESLLLLIISIGIIFKYLIKVSQPQIFVNLYLLTMVVKLLAYGAYCFFMIAQDRASATHNVVFFLLNYLAFTALEIVFLYRKTKVEKLP